MQTKIMKVIQDVIQSSLPESLCGHFEELDHDEVEEVLNIWMVNFCGKKAPGRVTPYKLFRQKYREKIVKKLTKDNGGKKPSVGEVSKAMSEAFKRLSEKDLKKLKEKADELTREQNLKYPEKKKKSNKKEKEVEEEEAEEEPKKKKPRAPRKKKQPEPEEIKASPKKNKASFEEPEPEPDVDEETEEEIEEDEDSSE